MKKSSISLLTAGLLVSMIGTANAWETSNPFEGVTYNKLRGTDVHPILGWSSSHLDVDVMEINLGADGISFQTTPSNGSLPGQTTRQTTLNFMKATNTEIAINTTFFGTDGSGGNNVGLTYSAGNLVSAFHTDFPAINISSQNQVELVKSYYSNQYGYWNAFAGSDVIVENGQLTGNGHLAHANQFHPRTAAGYNAAENKLILMTVDGRRSDSIGVKNSHLGKLMKNFGATWAVNLDGGGSTQMTMNNGTAHYVNTPSEKYRAVASNLGVHANIDNTYREIANFDHGNIFKFDRALNWSGSSDNVSSSSSFTTVTGDAAKGDGSVKLTINEIDAAKSWTCRFLSGSGSSANNIKRTTDGYIGIWAKTAGAGESLALALDDGSAMEISDKIDLIGDNQWHYYEWNLDDNSDWNAFAGAGANGAIDSLTFSLDSVFLYGNSNSVIYLDNIAHDSDESMVIPEPATLGLMALTGLAMLRRRR